MTPPSTSSTSSTSSRGPRLVSHKRSTHTLHLSLSLSQDHLFLSRSNPSLTASRSLLRTRSRSQSRFWRRSSMPNFECRSSQIVKKCTANDTKKKTIITLATCPCAVSIAGSRVALHFRPPFLSIFSFETEPLSKRGGEKTKTKQKKRRQAGTKLERGGLAESLVLPATRCRYGDEFRNFDAA